MINHNNYTPFVILCLIILAGCIVLGLLLGGSSIFNSPAPALQAQSTATAGAMVAQATGIALQASSAPIQQTTTHEASVAQSNMAAAAATQTVQALQLEAAVLQAAATQEQVAQVQAVIQQQVQATATQLAAQAQQASDDRSNANRRALVEDVLMVALAIGATGISFSLAWSFTRFQQHSRPYEPPSQHEIVTEDYGRIASPVKGSSRTLANKQHQQGLTARKN